MIRGTWYVVRPTWCVVRGGCSDAVAYPDRELDEAALDLLNLLRETAHSRVIHESKTRGELELALQLTARADRDFEEPGHFGRPSSTATLRDVGADRSCRAAKLRNQTKQLGSRKGRGKSVYLDGKVLCVKPDPQLPKILQVRDAYHRRLRLGTPSTPRSTYHLPL